MWLGSELREQEVDGWVVPRELPAFPLLAARVLEGLQHPEPLEVATERALTAVAVDLLPA